MIMVKSKLQKLQKKLELNLTPYRLDKAWFSHPLIPLLREKIKKFMPPGLYDPQDLEHQVLFRLTTYDPETIKDDLIREVIEEQLLIIEQRLARLKLFDLEYILRGLSGKHKDLNIHNRLKIKTEKEQIMAGNNHFSLRVEFRKIEDPGLIRLFTFYLHYIHSERMRGDAFGLFFEGDQIPWAIETTEPAILAKQYKRDALLAHGIDPNKAIELTRLYLLPGSPRNAISLLDKLVARYYKKKDIEVLFTTTMPMYFKTKGATLAGGLNRVLLVKESSHKFMPVKINGRVCYQHVVHQDMRKNPGVYLETHPKFPTLYTVETFMPINNLSLDPLPVLKDRVIFVPRSLRQEEKELKFQVVDILETLRQIRKVAEYKKTLFIRDTIWGDKSKKKIRLREVDTCDAYTVEASLKYELGVKKGCIRASHEETLYRGGSLREAIKTIKGCGNWRPENSYEKVRHLFTNGRVEIAVDIYPFGVFVELEGEEREILATAKRLGLERKQALTKNADECYLEWVQKMGLKELWHVRFGLSDRWEKK